MGNYKYFFCNPFCVFSLILCTLFAGSIIGIVLLSYHQNDGCPKVDSCYYQVTTFGVEVSNTSTVYSYYYVINNQYMCSNFCTNPLDIVSCPTNGTTCDVTDEVKDFCKYQGFDNLFKPCYNNTYFWVENLCYFLMVLSLVSTCCCAKISYDEGKNIAATRSYNASLPQYVPPVGSSV
jgi:hypothetical protein